MSLVGIIGGSGLTKLKNLEIVHRRIVRTPYGEPTGPLTFGRLGQTEVVFLARHGYGHTIPPHQVNYRANIWALHYVGVRQIIAVAAVGGIAAEMQAGVIACPDQLIDYTHGRHHTFFEGGDKQVVHIDFSFPYCERLRHDYRAAAEQLGKPLLMAGVYAATQGPRLETAAEIRRIERDGGDMVGMTGSPEAQLARELGLCYAPLCLVVNPAAGKTEGVISLESLQEVMVEGMERVRQLLEAIVPLTSHHQGPCQYCAPSAAQAMSMQTQQTGSEEALDSYGSGNSSIPN